MENEVGGVCSIYGKEEKGIRSLVRKPEGKRELLKPRHRCDNNTETDHEGLGWGGWGFDCISIAQDREKWWTLVKTLMKFRFQSKRCIP
jgi:hypothetical protein